MDLLTATDLRSMGEFRLLARLGAGGMGQVFLATSLAGRMVAVKVINPELCRDEGFVRRFRNEVEAAQKVSGWYTAPVVAAGVSDSPPWLATAFVPGPSLDDIVTRHGPLPVAAVWRLAAGLAEALRAIHAAGLIHRDLKPANVLLAPDGPRVIDFGISRAVADTRLTATGAIIGTLAYMSPEQVQALATGPESDTFSLGSVLAFAAAGTVPFSGGQSASSASVMYRIVHEEPDIRALPVDVRGLVEACLAKDPKQRPDLGRVAAHSTASAERLGLSPAAFWPHEVAGVIQAHQAAVTAQIEALQVAPATHVEGAWQGSDMAGSPSYRGVPASGGPSRVTGPRAGPSMAPGAGGPAAGTAPSGQFMPGQTFPGHRGAARGTSRRGLLIGAGVGSIAVIGGGVGWALSSGSTGTPPAGSGTGGTPTSGQALPTSQALQKYYGTGTRRKATWKFPTGNAINANPGAGNGVVYVASTDNNLYAVNIATGKKVWSFRTGALYAAPQVVGDVVCLSTNAGHFYALSTATGELAWDVEAGAVATYRRTWAVNGGDVILAGDTVPLQAYDAATGAKGVRFRTQASSYVMALNAAGGVLYALDSSGVLYAFQAAGGTKIWHNQLLSSDDPPGTSLAIDGGGIYVGSHSGTLYSVDASTGTSGWTYQPGNGMTSDLAVADGVIYLKDDNGNLHAVASASGKKLWEQPGIATGFSGPAVAGGRVYYSTDLAIQAREAKSGAAIWAFTPASNASSFLGTPAVASGLVFIGCSDDGLYAVQA
jgi:outer membrane protein assembly factor BamB